MDAKKLFDETLPKLIADHTDKAKELNAIYQFNVSGDNGGEWTVDLKSDTPGITKGVSDAAECTIEISDTDFEEVLGDQTGQTAMQMFFQGRLKVTGDPTLATRIQEVFKLGQD